MTFALLAALVTLMSQATAVPSGAASGRVTGRILDAESHSPITGARVMLIPARNATAPPRVMGPLHAVTDANGQFVFDAIPPGRYRIETQKLGYAPLGDSANASTLDVAAGRPLAGLELALTRGGAITGRIVDAAGEPLSEITVHALRQISGQGGQGMTRTSQMVQTNDLGEFRLAGLPEGNYVVIAAPRPEPPFGPPAASAGGLAFGPTYYPGTTSRDAAQIITVGRSQTINGLQFSMVAAPAYSVAGVVVDENGSPLGGAMVTIMADPRNAGPGATAMGRTDQNGVFRIGGIVSGTYRVMAGTGTSWSVGSGSGGGGGIVGGVVTGGVYVGGGSAGSVAVAPYSGAPSTMPAPIDVTVNNADVTGVKIVLTVRR